MRSSMETTVVRAVSVAAAMLMLLGGITKAGVRLKDFGKQVGEQTVRRGLDELLKKRPQHKPPADADPWETKAPAEPSADKTASKPHPVATEPAGQPPVVAPRADSSDAFTLPSKNPFSGMPFRPGKCKPTLALEPIRLPLEGVIEAALVSPDGLRLAYAVDTGGRKAVVLDGQVQGPYDALDHPERTALPWGFSTDSKHFAVAVRNGWDHHLVVDGKPGPSVEEIRIWSIDYSPESETFACEVRKDGRWGWLVQGPAGAVLHWIQDSRPLAQDYRSVMADGNPSTPRIYNQPGRIVGSIPWLRTEGGFYLSADHRHTVYFVEANARMVETRRSMSPVEVCDILPVVDGKDSRAYRRIRDFWLQPSGGHYAFVGESWQPEDNETGILATSWRNEIVVDGHVEHTFVPTNKVPQLRGGSVIIGRLQMSPNDGSYAYSLTQQGGNAQLVIGGKRFGPFPKHSVDTFKYTSLDQYYYWHPGSDHDSMYTPEALLTFNGRQYGPFLRGEHFVVSPDRRHFALTVGPRGKSYKGPDQRVVVDGQTLGTVYDKAEAPIFSPNSNHVLFKAQKQGFDVIVVDGHEGPPEKGIQMYGFASDSSFYWYVTSRQNKTLVICNGHVVLDLSSSWSSGDLLALTVDNQHLVSCSYGTLSLDGTPITDGRMPDYLKGDSGYRYGLCVLNQLPPLAALPARDGSDMCLFMAVGSEAMGAMQLFQATLRLPAGGDSRELGQALGQ